MTVRIATALAIAVAALAACQPAQPTPGGSGPVAQAPRAAARAYAVPSAPLPATPGALPQGSFRTESGNVVEAHTLWQTMGGATLMGRLVPNNRDASLQSQASVFVGGPNSLEVLEWWRSAGASSVVMEIDGRPVLNLPCHPGGRGPNLRCYDDSGDIAAIENARAAMRRGQNLRLVFLSGATPVSEVSFSLAGFRA